MAEHNIAVQPRLNIPHKTDMLGDGVNIAPRALHGVAGLQPPAAGQR